MLFVRKKPADAPGKAKGKGLFVTEAEQVEDVQDVSAAEQASGLDALEQAPEAFASESQGLETPEAAPASRSKGLFGRKKKTAEPADSEPAPPRKSKKKAKEAAARPSSEPLPVRVLMGFLPEVSARDAAEYALGVAQRHFDQPGIAFYDAFPYANGYVYEVHEGGAGRAWAPEILRHFLALGPFEPGESHPVVLPTATRSVRIERTREGLTCVLLPESDTTPPSEGFTPRVRMRPAVAKRTALLVAGALIFVTGFLSMTMAQLTRLPVYEPPPKVPDYSADYRNTPSAQWDRVRRVNTERMYVKALRFDKGAWTIDQAPVDEPPGAAAAPATPDAQASPATTPTDAQALTAPDAQSAPARIRSGARGPQSTSAARSPRR